jgi:Mg2+ and Co2+ transporter CorA
MNRLINELMGYDGKLSANNPVAAIKQVVADIVCGDLSKVLVEMSCTLDLIELALSDDKVLQSSMPMWRDMLGRWRNSLFHQSFSLSYLLESLRSDTEALSPAAGTTIGGALLTRKISRLKEDLERMRSRIEAAFQALMSTMSIVESERAIKAAEAISKLTYLAFFFIPLSLVASIFGMNVGVRFPFPPNIGKCIDVAIQGIF